MPPTKPDYFDTLNHIKDYIRYHKLNKPELRLGMKKSDLIKGLKKLGHYEYKNDPNRPKSPKRPKPVRGGRGVPYLSPISRSDRTRKSQKTISRLELELSDLKEENKFLLGITDDSGVKKSVSSAQLQELQKARKGLRNIISRPPVKRGRTRKKRRSKSRRR